MLRGYCSTHGLVDFKPVALGEVFVPLVGMVLSDPIIYQCVKCGEEVDFHGHDDWDDET